MRYSFKYLIYKKITCTKTKIFYIDVNYRILSIPLGLPGEFLLINIH